MSFVEKMQQAALQSATPPDPWLKLVTRAVQGMEMISTTALLDLMGVPQTTANARRIAAIMQRLKFVSIQSRRLMPGGHRDTVTRGWARPIRQFKADAQAKGVEKC